ncbi:hypothetical protein D3C73_577810 [compost metagenome]
MVRLGCMFGVVGIHDASLWDIKLRFSHENPIHIDFVTKLHILHKKFMLGRNIFL